MRHTQYNYIGPPILAALDEEQHMAMNDQLKAMIAAERKNARELKELRDLRKKETQKNSPDPQVLQMIDTEIANYSGAKLV